MTKKLTLFAIVMAAFILFVGCKKEQKPAEKSARDYYNSVQSKVPYSDIYVREKLCRGENGSSSILVFSSLEALYQTIADLSNQVETLDSIFYARNSDLSDDERADLQETINYDASTPISTFNTFLQFNSLFQELKGQEDVWLANDSLDLSNDPDNHFILEESLRAVLNTDCEVQIADTIYKLMPNGYYSIPVSQSRNDKALVELAGSIYFHGDGDCDECNRGDCFSGRYIWEYVKSNDKKRMIKCTLGHLTYFRRYVTASVTNYKKRNWGIGWKKYSTYCEVKVYGKVSGNPGNCSTFVYFNPNNIKKTSPSAKSLTHKIHVPTKTSSGWVKAFPAVKTKHGFLLVGELGGRLYKPYKSTYEYTLLYGIDENGICLPDGYIIDYLVLNDAISVSCFAKIGLEKPTHKGNMLRFNLLYDYSFREIGAGEFWKGCNPNTHYGTLSQRFSYVGVEFSYGFRIR